MLFFSEQLFYFARFSGGNKKYSLQAARNRKRFFFFEKLEQTSKQKKKRNGKQKDKKKLQNGKIRVNEIFYSSLNKCSILSDSQWENKKYSLKAAQNRKRFLFCIEKLELTHKQKKRNEMLTGRTKNTPNW